MQLAEASDIPARTRFRLTVGDYYQLADMGAFKGHRVELIEGEIIKMSPMGTPHRWAVTRLTQIVVSQVGDPYMVSVQCPLQVSDFSEPEPDLAIVRPPDVAPDKYTVAHASLIIEVSNTSLSDDLGIKMMLYARAGVPEYWVLDLLHNELVVHRGPSATGYTQVTHHERAQTVKSQTVPAITFTVGDALR